MSMFSLTNLREKPIYLIGLVALIGLASFAYPIKVDVKGKTYSDDPSAISTAKNRSSISKGLSNSYSTSSTPEILHTLVGSYYLTDENIDAKLLLNNKGNTQLEVRPTLYNKRGQESSSDQTGSNCGPAVEGFRLCASTEKSKYLVGEGIVLHLVLKNVSNEDKTVGTASNEYKYVVKNESNERVDFSEKEKNNPFSMLVSARQGTEVKAKGNLENQTVISNKYDFSHVGKYKISVSHLVPKLTTETSEKEHVNVISNEVQIEITKPLL